MKEMWSGRKVEDKEIKRGFLRKAGLGPGRRGPGQVCAPCPAPARRAWHIAGLEAAC